MCKASALTEKKLKVVGPCKIVGDETRFWIFNNGISLPGKWKGVEQMRTITYGGAVSLDGFLAGLDGSIDWLHFSKDVQQVMTDYWKNVDTILMGRKTYAFAIANTPKKSEPRKIRSRAHAPMSSPAHLKPSTTPTPNS